MEEAWIWVPLAVDIAAGYRKDAVGEWALAGLVIYGPDTDTLRGVRLRRIARLPAGLRKIDVLHQAGPPTPAQVVEVWKRSQAEPGVPADVLAFRGSAGHDRDARAHAGPADAVAVLDADLVRRRGEDHDEFYRRVARAHQALSRVSRRPTTELARLAGVPTGTAAAWVSRARARGLYGRKGDEM